MRTTVGAGIRQRLAGVCQIQDWYESSAVDPIAAAAGREPIDTERRKTRLGHQMEHSKGGFAMEYNHIT